MAKYQPYIKKSETELMELPLNATTLATIPASGFILSTVNNTSENDTAGTWTVTIPNITELTEGLTIRIRLKTFYNSSDNTLNVNGLGAKTVYFKYGTKLGSQYPRESILALTYTETATGSGTDTSGWIVETVYDSTNTQSMRGTYTRFITKSILYKYKICFVNYNDQLIPVNNVDSTATTKELTTESFDLFKSIYYYNLTTSVAAGSLPNTNQLWTQYNYIDLRYSFNIGTTLTANKPVYLVVVPQADGQVKLSADPITQTLPTEDTDNWYVFLGVSYSTFQIELNMNHPIYVHRNGVLRELNTLILNNFNNITNNTSAIETLQRGLEQAEGDFNALTSQVNTNTTNITNNATKISALQSSLSGDQEDIAQLQSDVSTISTNLDKKVDKESKSTDSSLIGSINNESGQTSLNTTVNSTSEWAEVTTGSESGVPYILIHSGTTTKVLTKLKINKTGATINDSKIMTESMAITTDELDDILQ